MSAALQPRALSRASHTLSIALLLASSGCAITALVGENPDAAIADVTASEAAIDAAVTPFDVVIDDTPRALPDLVEMDAAVTPDRLVVDRDRPGAGIDAVADDVFSDAGSIATPDLSSAPRDVVSTEDITRPPGDAIVGGSCRRDAECVADPAGPVCNLRTLRCGTSP